MRGGTWNLRYGRDPERVRKEVINLLELENLDWLGVQETNDYYDCLRGLPGFRYYTGQSPNVGAHRETGIIVRADHTVTHVKNKAFGDGWPGQGFRMRPRTLLRLRINNRHKVAVAHFPPHVDLGNKTPEDRYDDYAAIALACQRFMSGPSRFTRTIAMDANAHPSNTHLYSPSWIAKQTGSTLSAPDNRVDYFLTKGLHVTKVVKLRHLDETSDHDPVVMAAAKKAR